METIDAIFGPSRSALEKRYTGRNRVLIAGFVAACLLSAIFLRFHDIGRFGFWTDEFFHVFAAESFLRDGTLTVPLHGEYRRAQPITFMTVASFKLFGVSEAAARAPFAAVNVLFLLLAYRVVRRMYGLAPALGTLLALSFAPFMIEMSRECRMYTVFQLLYFSWTMMFIAGFEPARARPGWEGRLGIDARWLIGSAIVFPLSMTVHDLTWNGGVVIASYLLIMFCWEVLVRGPKAAALSKYGLGVALIVVGGAALLIGARDKVQDLIGAATNVPEWAAIGRDAIHYYRYFLSDTYPVFFFAYPLACFAFVREHGRRGLFAVVSFAVLFTLHSLVFGRKGDRYIFYIFPFFILVSSSLAAAVLVGLAQDLRAALTGTSRWVRAAGWLAAVPAAYIVFYPWLSNGIRQPFSYAELDWKAVAAETEALTRDADVIHLSPMPYLHYNGRLPDYYMLGEVWRGWDHEGRLIRDADDLRAALDRPGTAVIVTDQSRFGNAAFIDKAMADVIGARTNVEYSYVDRRIRYYEELPRKP